MVQLMDALINTIGILVTTLMSLIPVWILWNTQAIVINNVAQAIQALQVIIQQTHFKLKEPQEYNGEPDRANGFLQECEIIWKGGIV